MLWGGNFCVTIFFECKITYEVVEKVGGIVSQPGPSSWQPQSADESNDGRFVRLTKDGDLALVGFNALGVPSPPSDGGPKAETGNSFPRNNDHRSPLKAYLPARREVPLHRSSWTERMATRRERR